MEAVIPRSFYSRPAADVAKDLLGSLIVRIFEGVRLSGMIVETEAYTGPEDTACHASKGRTPRTEVMFGPPGHAYVYLVYGLHHMFNIVTGHTDFPAAVLIRGVLPLEGVETMVRLRGRDTRLSDGPGKLCTALSIDRRLNAADLTSGEELFLEYGGGLPSAKIAATPRIGIDYAEPADREALLRFVFREGTEQ